jgi:flagellin
MSLTINTNPAAIRASFNLTKNNKNLQASLTRLSSGKRITKPADDAGGLAVSMKLTSSISRTKAAISNIQNSLSFGEVQDGALQAGARIVDRLAELKTLSLDVMKSSADVANYNTEFKALQQQLHAITTETFNGVSLFASTTTAGGSMTFGTNNHTVSVFYFRSWCCWINRQPEQISSNVCSYIYKCIRRNKRSYRFRYNGCCIHGVCSN